MFAAGKAFSVTAVLAAGKPFSVASGSFSCMVEVKMVSQESVVDTSASIPVVSPTTGVGVWNVGAGYYFSIKYWPSHNSWRKFGCWYVSLRFFMAASFNNTIII